jgi:ATP-dependent Zn protease
MSETDIYKNREQVTQASDDPRFRKQKKRRRRSSGRRAFDEHDHRRRSKNSGFRRLLHLSRKSGNEKSFWMSILIAIVILLTLIGIWQFWYMEYVASEQAKKTELLQMLKESTEDAPATQVEDSAPAE